MQFFLEQIPFGIIIPSYLDNQFMICCQLTIINHSKDVTSNSLPGKTEKVSAMQNKLAMLPPQRSLNSMRPIGSQYTSICLARYLVYIHPFTYINTEFQLFLLTHQLAHAGNRIHVPSITKSSLTNKEVKIIMYI